MYQYCNIRGPFLIVAPLSTVSHWQREFEAWTDFNAVIYHGTKTARDVIEHYEFHSFEKDGKVSPILTLTLSQAQRRSQDKGYRNSPPDSFLLLLCSLDVCRFSVLVLRIGSTPSLCRILPSLILAEA